MTLDDVLADHVAAVTGLVKGSGHVLLNMSERIAACFAGGGKVLICGNGGSAADAQHFAAEFVNRMHMDRRALPAIALSTDTSSLTAIANDASYSHVFSRQVEALGRPGDILIGLTTSGRSANVLTALAAARELGMTTVGFTGRSGATALGPSCDIVLATPSDSTPRIQEGHEFAYHVVASLVERRMFGPADENESTEESE